MENTGKAGTARNENILNCLFPKPNAIFKLICFPWAGGGSFYFAKWGEKIPDSVEVHSIRLAGRERRSGEPLATDIYQIVDETVCALLPVIRNKPFAFFGHSLGSYIAFLTALHLKEKHKLEPIHLFVSSIKAPHVLTARDRERIADEQELNSFFLECGGVHTDILNSKDSSEYYFHLMKADVQLLIKYIFNAPSEPVLSCGLTAFSGSEDTVNDTDIKAWKDLTSGNFDVLVCPGDHFYFMKPASETIVRNYITKCLELSMLT